MLDHVTVNSKRTNEQIPPSKNYSINCNLKIRSETFRLSCLLKDMSVIKIEKRFYDANDMKVPGLQGYNLFRIN